jgi:hypothetical protein
MQQLTSNSSKQQLVCFFHAGCVVIIQVKDISSMPGLPHSQATKSMK